MTSDRIVSGISIFISHSCNACLQERKAATGWEPDIAFAKKWNLQVYWMMAAIQEWKAKQLIVCVGAYWNPLSRLLFSATMTYKKVEPKKQCFFLQSLNNL